MTIVIDQDARRRLAVKRDRYFVSDRPGEERETDEAGFIAMERACGFQPKPGCGPLATAGFSRGDRSGRIETWFDGPADVYDDADGSRRRFDDWPAAYDEARRLNHGLPRRRHHAMHPKG